MKNDGIVDFVELGPKSILSGMNKKISDEINTFSATSFETLKTVVTSLNNEKELV
jgi:malonyl CoA-acyl carrier protein transacylase